MIRDEFPALSTGTYLNTPSSGLLSKGLFEWRTQHDMEFLQEGSFFRAKYEELDLIGQCKTSLARLFNGNPDHTYLVPNFSLAFNALLDGLPSDFKYLLLQDEYPSISYPIASRGLAYSTVAPNAVIQLNLLEAMEANQPQVLVFSMVQYTSGLSVDLDLIRKIKASYPETLIIADGTQYCGTEVFDFKASGIDLLLCSGYKWMLAGYGNGFVLAKEAVHEAFDAYFSNAAKPDLPHLQGKSTLGFVLEPGHHDTLAIGSLKYAADWFQEINYPKVCRELHALRHKVFSALAHRDMLAPEIIKLNNPSCIFSLPILKDLETDLQQAGVICVQRGNRIRVGFHIYNTEEDLEKLLEVIDKNKGKTKKTK